MCQMFSTINKGTLKVSLVFVLIFDVAVMMAENYFFL